MDTVFSGDFVFEGSANLLARVHITHWADSAAGRRVILFTDEQRHEGECVLSADKLLIDEVVAQFGLRGQKVQFLLHDRSNPDNVNDENTVYYLWNGEFWKRCRKEALERMIGSPLAATQPKSSGGTLP